MDGGIVIAAVHHLPSSALRQEAVTVDVESLVTDAVTVVIDTVAELRRAGMDARSRLVAVFAGRVSITVEIVLPRDALAASADLPWIGAVQVVTRVGGKAPAAIAFVSDGAQDQGAGVIGGWPLAHTVHALQSVCTRGLRTGGQGVRITGIVEPTRAAHEGDDQEQSYAEAMEHRWALPHSNPVEPRAKDGCSVNAAGISQMIV